MISNENCNAVHENRNIASDHFEANPTELNQKLTTAPNATGNNPHLKEKVLNFSGCYYIIYHI